MSSIGALFKNLRIGAGLLKGAKPIIPIMTECSNCNSCSVARTSVTAPNEPKPWPVSTSTEEITIPGKFREWARWRTVAIATVPLCKVRAYGPGNQPGSSSTTTPIGVDAEGSASTDGGSGMLAALGYSSTTSTADSLSLRTHA
jgi:hypothetical protein